MTEENIDFATSLRNTAESPLWEEENARGVYNLPLIIDPELLEANAGLAQVIPDEQRRQVGPLWTQLSPESHAGPYRSAIDFLIDDGAVVVAAQEGKIIKVVQHNSQWGPGPEFAGFLNYLTIAHSNGEYSQYAHLAPFSIAKLGLTVGTEVQQGQPIALVGKTGWTDRDHLHFIVFRQDQGTTDLPNEWGFKSLIPNFAS